METGLEYGLIGAKLGHSFSPEIHAKIGHYPYELRELSPDGVHQLLEERTFRGLNVTIPYKELVIPLLDEISDRARKIGAVNTIVNRNGRLYGDNTDYSGAAALIRHAGVEISGRKVLILGTGGTSKTLRAVTEAMGARKIVRVSRHSGEGLCTYEEAARLAAFYSKGKEQEKVEIDYIERKHVKKVAGAKPGFVIYHTNYSMAVAPDISGIEEVTP